MINNPQHCNDTTARLRDAEQKIQGLELQVHTWMSKTATAMKETANAKIENANLVEQLATTHQQISILQARNEELEIQSRTSSSNINTVDVDPDEPTTQQMVATQPKRAASQTTQHEAERAAKRPRITKRPSPQQEAEHAWVATKTYFAENDEADGDFDFTNLDCLPVCAKTSRIDLEQVGRLIAMTDPAKQLTCRLNAFVNFNPIPRHHWYCLDAALDARPRRPLSAFKIKEDDRVSELLCNYHPNKECVVISRCCWGTHSYGHESVVFDRADAMELKR